MSSIVYKFTGLVAASLAAHALAASSKFDLSNVFGDVMVLQRDRPVTVWGFGTPAATVSASFSGPSGNPVCSVVGSDKIWRCTVPTTAAGGPYQLEFSTSTPGEASITLADVLFGDVYLIGGQSNAVFTVSMAFNGSAAVDAATAEAYPTMRLFAVGDFKDNSTVNALYKVMQNWTAVSPAAVNGTVAPSPSQFGNYFSAIGWFFGSNLYNRLNKSIPIGLISNNVGGTLIQEWTATSDLAPQCNQGGNPAHPGGYNSDLWDPMIFPYTVGPMELKGVVWYQAESNIDAVGLGMGGQYYACQFPVTIQSWRDAFQQPELPWIFVQLAAYTSKSGNTSNILPDMRQGQLNGTSLPNVWFVTAMDHGDAGSPWTDIHPRAKQPVGQRLADVAAGRLYGLDITHQSPEYGTATLVPAPTGMSNIHVRFNPSTVSANAVVVNDPSMGQSCPPTYNYTRFCSGFTVTYSDGSVVEVDASKGITVDADGMGITITAMDPADGVVAVATSYAYAPWPVTSLYTSDGWPVIPWSESIAGAT